MKEANEILDNAQTTHERVEPHIRDGAEYFHENEGTLFERAEAIDNLTDELNIEQNLAGEVLSQLISDTVDPIVQVAHGSSKHVGVVEFHEFEGAYGYVEFDDGYGKAKRVVCQQCVNEADRDLAVTHATANDPDGSFGDVDYDELLTGVHEHYEEVHDAVPSDVETGATLASGTTIGGNTSFHAGNESGITVENTSTTGASGTVPKSDGAGGLTMGTVGGNVPNWQEDANSPFTAQSTTSITATLAGTYDFVLVEFDVADTASVSSQTKLQVNGDTGSNYIYVKWDGTETFSANAIMDIAFCESNSFATYVGKIMGRWGDGAAITSVSSQGQSNRTAIGTNRSVTSPLDSITVSRPDAADWTVRLYGRDIA